MSKKIVSLFLALLMAVSMTAAMAQTVTVTDMFDREVTLTGPVTRIVALEPSDCEILCALGAEDTLIGRGEYCNYPESILSVPSVQSGAETNIEQILALQPQVVLMNAMAQSAEGVQALENAGVKVVVSDADDIAGTYISIRLIGALLDKSAEAEALIADMQATFDDIAAKSESIGKNIYFEVSPLEWGLWTAGANTFMNELATMCGLTNAFADVDGWAEVSEEQVILRDPDYIATITMYYGEGPTPEEEILGRAGWQSIKAIANGNVLAIDSDSFSRPGPRLKDAAMALFDFVSSEPAA